MALDLALDSERDVFVDETGDLGVVRGDEQLNQHVMLIATPAIWRFVSNRVTGETIGRLEESVQQALLTSPRVSSVGDVTVTEYDTTTNTVVLDVLYNATDTTELEVTV
jgi:hypothetical protein